MRKYESFWLSNRAWSHWTENGSRVINDDAPEEAKRSYAIYRRQIQEELELHKKLRKYRIRVLKEFSKDYPWIIIEGTISFKLSNGYQMSIESSRMGGHGALSIFLSMDCEENDVEEVKDFLLSDYTDPHEIYLAMREWLKKYEEKQQPELSDSYTPNN